MYADVIEGLVERLETVPGNMPVLPYEPPVLQKVPAIYLKLDSFTREIRGQVTANRYRIQIRAVLLWQDARISESELLPLVNLIPAAIDNDPQLGGRLEQGVVVVTDGRESLRGIGGTVYKVLDVFVDAVEKGEYQTSGI